MGTKLKEAVAEAKVYNRMGGLDYTTARDISFEFGVSVMDLAEGMGWDREHWDDET